MACSCQLKDLRSPLSVVLISDPAVETPPAGGRAAAVDYLIIDRSCQVQAHLFDLVRLELLAIALSAYAQNIPGYLSRHSTSVVSYQPLHPPRTPNHLPARCRRPRDSLDTPETRTGSGTSAGTGTGADSTTPLFPVDTVHTSGRRIIAGAINSDSAGRIAPPHRAAAVQGPLAPAEPQTQRAQLSSAMLQLRMRSCFPT